MMITLKEKDFNLGSVTEFSTKLEVTKSVTSGYVDLVHTTYEDDVEYVSCISLDLEDVKAIANVFGYKMITEKHAEKLKDFFEKLEKEIM